MTVRWTQPATDDFPGIVEWIITHNPTAAAPVGRRIPVVVEQFAEFPFRGKPGRSPDTRELVISGLPYLVVCSIEANNLYSGAKGKIMIRFGKFGRVGNEHQP